MNQVANAGPSPIAEDVPLHTNIKQVVVASMLIILLGFGSFLLWACLAPLDEGVVAPGVITVMSYRKTIQHMKGGIVEEILVVDGSRVKQGQLLVKLNDAQPKASLAAAVSEYMSVLATEARLLAERELADRISFPEELMSFQDQSQAGVLISRQEELFRARRKALNNEKAIVGETIQGLQEYTTGLDQLQKSQAKQIELLKKEMGALRVLSEQGYYPRNRIVEMERTIAELTGKRSEELGNLARARNAISENKMRIAQLDQNFIKDVEQQLSEAQKRRSALKEQYAYARDEVERTEIRSPEDGVVLGLKIHTVGGVIGAGVGILDIVPENAALIVEAKVSPSDIDKMHNGLKADLRFSAFKTKILFVVEGDVIMVSADRLVDQATNVPYYLCRVQITPEGFEKLAGFQLQAGMPVEVIIKTGTRTLMNYILKPFLNRLAVSMKEQ